MLILEKIAVLSPGQPFFFRFTVSYIMWVHYIALDMMSCRIMVCTVTSTLIFLDIFAKLVLKLWKIFALLHAIGGADWCFWCWYDPYKGAKAKYEANSHFWKFPFFTQKWPGNQGFWPSPQRVNNTFTISWHRNVQQGEKLQQRVLSHLQLCFLCGQLAQWRRVIKNGQNGTRIAWRVGSILAMNTPAKRTS